MSAIHAIPRPRRTGVGGAFFDASKLTGRPIACLQAAGFGGAILPIPPRHDEIAGLKSHASAADPPEAPDPALAPVG